MRKLAIILVVLATRASAQAAEISSGSGVMIGDHGEVLTNAHVVNACAQIIVRSPAGDSVTAQLIARDEKNDLAVVRTRPLSSVATFRDGKPVRAGDAIVALGYPLARLLATTANLTVGNVSALAGLRDDSRYLQISAPVQPGNSGGPLLDGSGHLVGIVTGKLDAALVARVTGDIPQNVNFALKAEVARTFLDSKGIAYHSAPSDKQLSPADIGDVARPFTLRIECEEISTQVAMPVAPNPPTSRPNKKTEPLPRWGMQLTANWSESKAWATYRMIQKQFAALIGDRKPIVIRSGGIGLGFAMRYNIRIVDDDRAYLEELCRKLIAAGGACIVLENDRG
jgi:Trypsin-like peptidase domain